MILKSSPTSPYVRKVLVQAHETGVIGQLDLQPTNPYDETSGLRDNNPLGKIPALITSAGDILFDSPVICEFLDTLHDGDRVFPSETAARMTALRQQALGDGVLDAALLWRYEGLRDQSLQSGDWIDRQRLAIESTLNRLDREVVEWPDNVTIGRISVGCALGYLDFRFGDTFDWRDNRVSLAAWYQFFSTRDSMQQTVPVET